MPAPRNVPVSFEFFPPNTPVGDDKLKDVVRQLRLDATLVEDQDWTISWYVEGRCSGPLKKALSEAGISLVETHPHVR